MLTQDAKVQCCLSYTVCFPNSGVLISGHSTCICINRVKMDSVWIPYYSPLWAPRGHADRDKL